MSCKTCEYSSLSWYEEPCKSCCPAHSGYEAIDGKEQGMNEQLEKDIRAEIEEVKELKRNVGEINSHLNTIEQLCAFDMEALEQREKEAYQKGLDDAWYAAKKIALMDTETSENVTGYFGLFRIMENLTPMQAIEKLKAYEEKQSDNIKVGDVVAFRVTNEKGIVTRVDKVGANVLLGNGHTGFYAFNLLKKTNKQDSSIEAILKRIAYENN